MAMDHKDKSATPFDNFQHVIYESAAIIFAYLKGNENVVLPAFDDERVKRRAYSLAFGAKKYESVLNDILLDSYFFSSFFKLGSVYRNHVMVMLLDYQQNDFQFGETQSIQTENQYTLPHIKEIQDALVSFYTKLRASLARNRIRETALTVEDLLPKEEREKTEFVCYQPIYAYVNNLRTSVEEVCKILEASGFAEIDVLDDFTAFTGHCFTRDVHLNDVLIFPRDVKFDVYNHKLVEEGLVVIQDKSMFIAPEVIRSVLFQMSFAKEKASAIIPGEIRPTFSDGDDVIIVNSNSVNLIVRISSYVHPVRSLIVFGVKSHQYEDLRASLDHLGVQNVVLQEENFLDILPNDERFAKVRVILCNANCSKSGVVSPIDYVLQEGTTCVQDLANSIESNRLRALVLMHQQNVSHAMKFNFVCYIVYVTNSIFKSENEEVIRKVVDANHSQHPDGKNHNPFVVTSFLPDLTAKLRRFSAKSVRGTNGDSLVIDKDAEKFLKLNGKMGLNGGFVCLLQRQKLTDSASDVLERAAKKGLIKGTKRSVKKDTRRPISSLNKHKPTKEDEEEQIDIGLARKIQDTKKARVKQGGKEQKNASDTRSLKPFQF